jgi:hypothetical protein
VFSYRQDKDAAGRQQPRHPAYVRKRPTFDLTKRPLADR